MGEEITFSNGSVVLAGTLTVPGGGPAPGVVTVSGPGSADRHNDTHFPALHRHLVDAGFAVLSYDKRGVGGSSGDWRDTTIDGLAGDASAALDFLRSRPGVRAEASGLLGHSEGGWVVLRAATGRDDVPWVVTSGCPGVRPAVQDRHALATSLRGGEPAAVAATLAAYDRVVEVGRRDLDLASATRVLRATPMPAIFDDYWEGVDERLWTFTKRKQDHDPVPDLLGLRCPLLAVFGGADPLVPVADSVRAYTAAACHPDRHHAASLMVHVFPHADHRVRVDDGTRLAPGYPEALTRWLRAHTDR
ncbi:alpha/beta hydrolase family protein [Saccharothrix obliqua]|uniref:alpha/beta hydrolase family protein n=1 Tax=Saccharothrix obliqua TaxID=2861747 RepID=UPI001C5F6A2F|nr:alpha/beta hydrolase [Saccharothrix obliqua]MBW4722064.1 alpha/beta hydrolase [Saccharothrix obliqua]